MAEQSYFKELEKQPEGTQVPSSVFIEQLNYNEDGLIPAIAQQYDTGEVLMMAWMNQASIKETLETGKVCYWSRSRQRFWRKGETSGQQQRLKTMRTDCDGDTLLLLVDQDGAACHTGRRDCFYLNIEADVTTLDKSPIVDPNTLYGKK